MPRRQKSRAMNSQATGSNTSSIEEHSMAHLRSRATPKSAQAVSDRRVERRAILRKVLGEHAPSIVLLQAPAGHGKSVTLAQIRCAMETDGYLCAWLTLDTTDNDSRRHSHHLRGLIAQLGGQQNTKIRSPRGAARSTKPPQRADWFIDALSQIDRKIALFIDEFETLTDRAILTFWRDFLGRCEGSVRVFLGSRGIPELGLARLLVGNRLLLLSSEDLRFTKSEVAQFFGLYAELSIHPVEIDAIYRRSEGWPAAVQLFRLGLSSPDHRMSLRELDESRPRELAEYLTECVLQSQTADVRDFLLRTSLLTRMSAPLCDHITCRTDSQSMLLKLEREGLFVRALDHDQRWFQYHPLFASLLAEQLEVVHPGVVADLRKRAATWHWNAEQWEAAMQSAIASQDHALACTILKQWASKLIASGEMATVERWLDQLPVGSAGQDLSFAIRMVWSLIFVGRAAKLTRYLQLVDERRRDSVSACLVDESTIVRAVAAMCGDHVEMASDLIWRVPLAEGVVEGFDAFEQAAAENLRAYLQIFRGKLADSHVHISRARSFNQLGDASFSGGYTACFEGALLLLEGHVRPALECLRAGLEEQRRVLDATFVSAAIASCYVWALYEANEHDLLEAVVAEYREILTDTAVPDFFAVGQICLARVHALRSRIDEAIQVIERAQFIAARNGWGRIVGMLSLERVGLGYRSEPVRQISKGDLARLLEADARLSRTWFSPADELAASTRYLLSSLSETSMSPRDGSSSVYRELCRSVHRVISARKAGRNSTAVRLLQRALALSATSGLVRPLLDHGDDVQELMRQALKAESFAHDSALQDDIRLLLGVMDSAHMRSPESQAAPRYGDFTKREREVLAHLARRLSNKEIARRTFLSENTVKFHLKNVFAKLGVASRLDAYATITHLVDEHVDEA